MQQLLKVPIVIPRVKIEGPKTFREIDMILDTGAAYTMISWDIAKDIGYDPAGSRKRTSIVTANGIIEVPLLKVKKIIVKDIAVKNVEVICHNIPEVVGIEGLLGLSFLKEFRTLIDYRKKILEII